MKECNAGLLFLLLFYAALELPAQGISSAELASSVARGESCLVWYNVENLFYPDNDSIAGDDEFTPQGLRHWTWSRYRDKLTALAKVIIASGRGEPPELVGLCEVENALVLEDCVLIQFWHLTTTATFTGRATTTVEWMWPALSGRGGSTSVEWETIAFYHLF